MGAALSTPRRPSAPAGPPRALSPSGILRAYGLRPNKRLGQHFLVDESYLERIVDAAEIEPADTVLEVGPGLGVLTEALCARAGRVVAVEIDAAMREILTDRLGRLANLSIVAADILAVDPVALLEADAAGGALGGAMGDAAGQAAGDARAPGATEAGAPALAQAHFGPLRGHYKVVANLPYYITSAVLRRLLEARERPTRAVVMVQKEVADRITAAPGDMSILAVAIQLHAAVQRVAIVPPGAFHPPPKVSSAVLRLDLHAAPPVPVDDVRAFFKVVRAGFGQKRKQLKNSVAAGLHVPDEQAVAALVRAGVDPSRRAQTLTLAEWAALTAAALADGLVAASDDAAEASGGAVAARKAGADAGTAWG
ncbi:MAG: rRNA adenine dimethyltransferase family protein [Anaerolineae bacterium]